MQKKINHMTGLFDKVTIMNEHKIKRHYEVN